MARNMNSWPGSPAKGRRWAQKTGLGLVVTQRHKSEIKWAVSFCGCVRWHWSLCETDNHRTSSDESFCRHWRVFNRAIFKLTSVAKYWAKFSVFWRIKNGIKICWPKIPRMVADHDTVSGLQWFYLDMSNPQHFLSSYAHRCSGVPKYLNTTWSYSSTHFLPWYLQRNYWTAGLHRVRHRAFVAWTKGVE